MKDDRRLRSPLPWVIAAAAMAAVVGLSSEANAVGLMLSVGFVFLIAVALHLMHGRDLFAPAVMFPIAYIVYFALGSHSGVRGYVPPRVVALEALGLAGYIAGVWLLGVIVGRPLARWPSGPSPLSPPTLPIRWSLAVAVSVCLLVSLAAAALIVLTLGGTPLANLGERHGLSAYLFELVELGWVAVVWWNFDLWLRTRRLSPSGLLLIFAMALVLAAMAYRTPLLMMVMTLALGFHRIVRPLRPHQVAALMLVLVLFAGVYGWWRLQRTERYGGYRQYLEVTRLEWSPLEPIAPLVATVSEGPLVLTLLTERVPSMHGFQRGAVTFSTVATLLPGWQRGPREWIGIYARGNEHSTTPTILGFPYVDFGVPGVAVAMLLFGMGIAALYHLLDTRPSPLAVWLWAYFSAALLLSIHTGFADLRHFILTGFAMGLAWTSSQRPWRWLDSRAGGKP